MDVKFALKSYRIMIWCIQTPHTLMESGDQKKVKGKFENKTTKHPIFLGATLMDSFTSY